MPLPESKWANLAPYEGKEVVLGIRPEDIAINDEISSVKVNIDVVELMGSEMYLYSDLAGSKLTVRTPVIDNCKADAELWLAFNTNKLHIFDKETEKVISN